MGNHSTHYDDGFVHHYIWEFRKTPIRWNSVSDIHVLRFVAVELFCPVPRRFEQQPGRVLSSGHQGLFPPACAAVQPGFCGPGRFIRFPCGPYRPDALVRHIAHRRNVVPAGVPAYRHGRRTGSGPLVNGP